VELKVLIAEHDSSLRMCTLPSNQWHYWYIPFKY